MAALSDGGHSHSCRGETQYAAPSHKLLPVQLDIRLRLSNNERMSQSLLRPLVLLSAILLAFPSGWCCLLPLPAKQTPAVQESATCCRHQKAKFSQATCCSGNS